MDTMMQKSRDRSGFRYMVTQTPMHHGPDHIEKTQYIAFPGTVCSQQDIDIVQTQMNGTIGGYRFIAAYRHVLQPHPVMCLCHIQLSFRIKSIKINIQIRFQQILNTMIT